MKAKEIEKEIEDSEYIDVLNELYGEIKICGQTFDAGYALQKLDPTAFRCSKVNYESEFDSQWQCSECDEIYDDQDEAEECCKPEEE